MTLASEVREVFAAQGLLGQAAEQFLPRSGQTEMAVAVAQTLEHGGVLVVEAGTGVGKTFSYLVPALLSGERVLLSTATKTLQDQLYGRDLPRLVQALGLPTQTALLKGRASYLCIERMQSAQQRPEMADRSLQAALAKVERWAQSTRTGDLAELVGLDERSALIPLVTSTRDNCLGSECPSWRACYVNQARREALAADVVVINHHLFFADLSVRESGMAELLPSVRLAIFDEAHQLNETGVQFLGQQLSTAQLIEVGRDLLAVGLKQARGLADWQSLGAGLERAGRDLRMLVGRANGATRLRWTQASPEGVDAQDWADSLDQAARACQAALAALQPLLETGPELARLGERLTALAQRIDGFGQERQPESVRWVDVGTQLRLLESPLDIAATVRSKLLGLPAAGGSQAGVNASQAVDPDAPPAKAPEPLKAWVFTSATLGTDAALSWFTEPCGLESARTLRVQSPFDYAQQAAVYVPSDFPRPNESQHSSRVAELAAAAAARLGGRTMVLTTTLRALRSVGEQLQQHFGDGRLQVLVQGQLPKRQLIERFRLGDSEGGVGCVLVASASFWEGVDVPGDALQLVIIDKLPFPPPNDPLVEARSQRLERTGRNPFNEYFVPEAAVALKQGAGRLIRRESDQGLLVLCDTRLTQMGYGRRLLAALPPMRRLTSAAQFEQALSSLALSKVVS